MQALTLVAMILLGALAGAGLAWLLARSQADARIRAAAAGAEAGAERWRSEYDRANQALAVATERASRVEPLEQQARELAAQLADLRESSSSRMRELETRLRAEQEQSGEKLALLTSARDELSNQFKALANDILEEKSKRFTEQNQQTLGQLLDPLKEKLVEFRGKVEEVYVQEGKDRTALAEQVRQLMSLNQVLSQEAKNLTSALKGSVKVQGNWGELILERVLEASGLQKGIAYRVQQSEVREDGTEARPDVVIDLPADRRLVVDAKVSLVAYDKYVSAEDDIARKVALDEHLRSVRRHMEGLSKKRYEDLYGLDSIDFVVMFVPIEPAFMLAVGHDEDLFMQAWKRNVLLVSPSTLLFVVRTIDYLWTQEARNRNAQDIAQRGAELYDKFCGFVDDVESIGARLRQAQQSYEAASAKLSTGKGNLVRQAEMLRELGLKPKKALPEKLVDLSLLEPAVAPALVPSQSTALGTDAPRAAKVIEMPATGAAERPET
jgi:DNA recombination protein RmuC